MVGRDFAYIYSGQSYSWLVVFMPRPQAEASGRSVLQLLHVLPGNGSSHARCSQLFSASATRLPHRVDFYGAVLDLKLFLNPPGTWVMGGKLGATCASVKNRCQISPRLKDSVYHQIPALSRRRNCSNPLKAACWRHSAARKHWPAWFGAPGSTSSITDKQEH